jgi:signal transduction histidine kinase
MKAPAQAYIDEARYERMTRSVLAVMACISIGFSALAGLGVALSIIPADTLFILFAMNALFGSGWFLAATGRWRIARHIPSAFILMTGIYGNVIGGMGAPAILLYVFAMILSATLQGRTMQIFIVVASILSYLAVAFLHQGGILMATRNDSSAFYNRIMIATSIFAGIAGTLRFLIFHLKDAMRLSIERGNELAAANGEMERRVAERTAELELAQNRLVQTEKLAALGRVAARVTHELNTPLGAVLSSNRSSVELLDSGLPGLPAFIASLSERELATFASLVGASLGRAADLEASAGRAELEAIEASFGDAGAEGGTAYSEMLAELGAGPSRPYWEELRGSGRRGEIVSWAYSFFTLRRLCEIVSVGAEKAARVVGALKGVLGQEDASPAAAVDLSGELESLLAIFQDKLRHGIKLEKRFAATPLVLGRRDLLNQAWTNLINNALQAMEYKGTLTIATELRGDRIVVEIADTGCGIPEAMRSCLFEPFVTSKIHGEGIGLGLYVTRSIIERCGGSIECESEPGNTVFRIYLVPAVSGTGSASRAGAPSGAGAGGA